MRKHIFISCLLLIHSFFLIAQPEKQDSALYNLATQMLLFPQERLYVQTDKPYYISGETVFFRAFLLNASSHKPADFSRYVYVELVNPLDSVVIRQQIRPENNLFYGTISIPENLPQGDYLFRAYTRFMTNLPEDYFFSKPIRIYDPITMKIDAKAEFEFIKKDQVGIHLQFTDAKTKEILHPEQINIRLNDEKAKQYKPDQDGFLHIKQDLSDSSKKRTLFVEFKTENEFFQKYLYIPYPENKLEVTFYPEGGNLIAGKLNQIAFKALKSDGTSADIQGAIYDSNDNKQVDFSTVHEGMGSLILETLPGEKYYAVCNMEGQSVRIALPETKSDTYSLKTQWRQDKLWISVNKSEELVWRKLYLFIHSRGNVLYYDEWDSSKEFIAMDKPALPLGISHILLLTEDFQPISERLIFSLNDDWVMANVQTGKKTYMERERVKMDIQLQNVNSSEARIEKSTESNLPRETGTLNQEISRFARNDENEEFLEKDSLRGNFAISVTDDKDIAPDTTKNILSEILLTSELRGYIPNPAYYFDREDKRTERTADLLMLTHGWTRYDVPKALRGDFQYLTVPNEEAQSLSGMVKGGLLSKPYSDGRVTVLSANTNFFDATETDKDGRFAFKHFEFADSTQYVVQALNKKGDYTVELYLDSITYPDIKNRWNYFSQTPENKFTFGKIESYVQKADLKYTYENGRRMVHLPEVTIRKRVEKERKYQSPYYREPDNSISQEEIEMSSAMDVGTLISRFPGVIYSNKLIKIARTMSTSIGNAEIAPLILIDGMRVNSGPEDMNGALDALNMLTLSDIAQIDIIKNISKLVIYGPSGYGGVIEIFTRKADTIPDKLKFNIQKVTPLGYQLPVEFYSPQYDTPEARNSQTSDLRSTIYWKPDVVVNKDGKASIDLYTADSPSTYSVVIEGVTPDGKLIYQKEDAFISVE